MLIPCPECERSVSDRAPTCPGCGFPIGEHVAQLAADAARDRDRASRRVTGEVDCVACEARGFTHRSDGFEWCSVCEHTGRVVACTSDRGAFAVSRRAVDDFVAGKRDDDGADVVFLGTEAPVGHRYPAAGKRVTDDDD